jgi:hypothetical protein
MGQPLTLTDLYAQTPADKRPGIVVGGVPVTDTNTGKSYMMDGTGSLYEIRDETALTAPFGKLIADVALLRAKLGA